MRASRYTAVGGDISVVDMPVPDCPVDGVLVDVRATGVCRSDWHAWIGHDPVPLPHTPGHEFAGTVRSVGPEVTRWHIGDRVTAPFVMGCGRCAFCRQGDPQVCPQQSQPGFTYDGSFAEVVVVQHADFNLVALPDAIDFTSAAALGCRFATAYRALIAHARLQPAEDVVVFGCGGVGLSAIAIAEAAGANVIAVDVSEPALRRAEQTGAHRTVLIEPDAHPEDIRRQVLVHTDGGAHVTLDATGSAATVQAAVLSLRPRGRHVQVGLLFGDDATPPVDLARVLSAELQIFGSHGIAAADYAGLFEFVRRHRVDLQRLVGRTISLDGAGAALTRPTRATGITVVTFDVPHASGVTIPVS